MRIDFLIGRKSTQAAGACLLLLSACQPLAAASFSIDPDPASPTLGEMLERESRKPAPKSEARRATAQPERRIAPPEPITREPTPRQQQAATPVAEPKPEPAAAPRVVTPVPYVPRNASTVILPRAQQRPATPTPPREPKAVAVSTVPKPAPTLADEFPEVTNSISRMPDRSPASEIRTEILPLDDIPYAELVRVMRAAEFDVIRYPVRHIENGASVAITATLERVARLEQLISLLKESRRDIRVVSQARPDARARPKAD